MVMTCVGFIEKRLDFFAAADSAAGTMTFKITIFFLHVGWVAFFFVGDGKSSLKNSSSQN